MDERPVRFRSVMALALILAASACAQLQPARAERSEVADPPITERGLYRLPTDETWCGEYCDLGRHYVHIDATDLFADKLDVRATPDPAAPVIDQLAMGEWIRATRSELHTRQRGVVRRAGDGYEVGDVVFQIIGFGVAANCGCLKPIVAKRIARKNRHARGSGSSIAGPTIKSFGCTSSARTANSAAGFSIRTSQVSSAR